MSRHLLGVLESAIVLQINRDAGCPPGVTSDGGEKTSRLRQRIASFLTAAGDNNAGTFVSECQRGGASDSREGSANKASGSSCAPSPMEKALPRRKHNFVR
jgi:hypothetical protein